MPTDTLSLHALAIELDNTLKGARIDKIYQPEMDEVTFLLRADNENKLLVISANPSVPRLYLSTQKKENPILAPSFCMLLRKYLTSARIQKVELFNCDRIIRFQLITKNEMMDEVTLYLYFEYMGRYSNLILTNGDDKILDVLRRISLDLSRSRHLLPGVKYTPPVQDKVNIFDRENLPRIVEFCNEDIDKLLKNVSGLSRESARELLWRAKSHTSLGDGFLAELDNLLSRPTPIVGYDKNGQPIDFFISTYHTLPYEYHTKASLSVAMEDCYTAKDTKTRVKSKTKHFLTIVKNAISRCEKKLGVNRQKLLDCSKAESDRIKGELLNANLYRIERGMTNITLLNYYDNTEITISLDGTKSPSQNAQNYFRRYTKLKRTKETVEKMIEENEQTLLELRSLLYDVESVELESDVKDIESILVSYGLIDKKPTKSKQVQKPSKPYVYLYKGVEILVGRNSIQNDDITFRTSQKTDTWLHVKNYHGSHVVVKSDKVDDEILLFASELASYYSEANTSDKVDVDYTKIKCVKRHPSKKIGLVVYDNYATISAKPNQHKDMLK